MSARGYRYTGCATGNGYEATPAEQERQRRMVAAATERNAGRYSYGWNQELEAFEVRAPERDGGRVLHTFSAKQDRERAHDNAAAMADHYNRGNTPRQLALI